MKHTSILPSLFFFLFKKKLNWNVNYDKIRCHYRIYRKKSKQSVARWGPLPDRVCLDDPLIQGSDMHQSTYFVILITWAINNLVSLNYEAHTLSYTPFELVRLIKCTPLTGQVVANNMWKHELKLKQELKLKSPLILKLSMTLTKVDVKSTSPLADRNYYVQIMIIVGSILQQARTTINCFRGNKAKTFFIFVLRVVQLNQYKNLASFYLSYCYYGCSWKCFHCS